MPVVVFGMVLVAALALGPARAAPQADGSLRVRRVPGDSVIGTVRDAATGRPMRDVQVSGPPGRGADRREGSTGPAPPGGAVERPTVLTDAAGRFVLRGLRPGHQLVTIEMRPYVAARRTVVVPHTGNVGASRPPVLEVALRRGPPPGVSLGGRWSLALTPGPARSATTQVVAPLRGTFTLRETAHARQARVSTQYRFVAGTFIGDVARRSRGDVPDAPWTPGRTEDARGAVFFGDSVLLRVGQDGFSHADLALRGRLTGDSASGVWELEGAGAGAAPPAGHFVMRRGP